MTHDVNATQREATTLWYIEWLAENRPDLGEEDRTELAKQFVLEQNPVPPAPDDETDDERKEREASEEKLAKLRRLAYSYTRDEMQYPGPRKL